MAAAVTWRLRQVWLVLVLVCTVCSAVRAVPGYAQEIDEIRFINLQAAYLYNIAKLIKWPNLDNQEAFVMCLPDDANDTLYQSLQTGVDKRRIQDKPIVVKRTHTLGGCHLVYLVGKLDALASESQSHLQDAYMLRIAAPTVEDNPYALVSMVLEEGRIALYINGNELSRSELTINPALLSIARPR